MKTISKIAWIHIKDRKVLMVRTKGKDAFYFPGGKPEPHESNAQALTRELREELGISFKLASATQIGPTFETPAHGHDGVSLECRCLIGEFTGNPSPQGEIEEARYFSWNQREQLTPMGIAVFEYLHAQGLI